MIARRAASPFRRIEPGQPFTVPVRDRAFLAGSAHRSFPRHIPDAGDLIPAFSTEATETPAAKLATAVRDVIDENLPVSGGVLLRGLHLADQAGFEQLMAGLGYTPVGYHGGAAVRETDSGLTLNASGEDHRITLSPHNEMAYLPRYPRKVFFYCDLAAAEGGEVPVNDVRNTSKIIPEAIKNRYRAKGVRYYRNLPLRSACGEIGWPATFGTDDKERVERQLQAFGCECEWGENDRLRYHYTMHAFTIHPETGEELWFNQITELHCSYWQSHPDFAPDRPDYDYPATTTYGDGSAINLEEISFLRGTLWRTAHAVRMRRGDVLVLDNQVLQHGRFAYEGNRRHFVSLTE